MRVLMFGAGTSPGTFYFIPTIRYSYGGGCGCWMVSIVWGNLTAQVFTTCDPEILKFFK